MNKEKEINSFKQSLMDNKLNSLEITLYNSVSSKRLMKGIKSVSKPLLDLIGWTVFHEKG